MSFNKALLYAGILIIGGYFINKAINKTENTTLIEEQVEQETTIQEQETVIFNRADFGVFQSLQRNNYPKKIFVNIAGGQRLIAVEDIVYCESAKGTKHLNLLLSNDNEIEFEQETIKNTSLSKLKSDIGNPGFIFKKNKSNIININFVEKILENIDGNNNYFYFVELSNGKKVSLPTAKKEDFHQTVRTYYNNY